MGLQFNTPYPPSKKPSIRIDNINNISKKQAIEIYNEFFPNRILSSKMTKNDILNLLREKGKIF